jgi:hypothetical protein
VVKLNAKPHLLGKTKVQQTRQMDSSVVIKCEHHKDSNKANWVPTELPDEEDKLPLHLPRQEPQELAMPDADLNDEQWEGVEFKKKTPGGTK